MPPPRVLVRVVVLLVVLSLGKVIAQTNDEIVRLDPDDSLVSTRFDPTPTNGVGATSEYLPENDVSSLPRSPFQPTIELATSAPTEPTQPTQPTQPKQPTNATPSLSPVANELPTAIAGTPDLTFLRHEIAQLEREQTTLTKRIRASFVELELLDLQLQNEKRFYAETHASAVVRNALPSPRGAVPRPLECQGWKKTARCSVHGDRRPALDRSCLTEIRGGAAGYCEVRDADSGDFYKVMRVDCDTVRTTATFWCELAPQFANFPAAIERVVVQQKEEQQQQQLVPATATASTSGIVLVVLATQLPLVERTLRALRSLGCTLPIELWYFERDMVTSGHTDAAWAPTDAQTTLRPFTTLPFMPTTVKYATIHALLHSRFTHVLSLDVGVLPLRDPTYLFSLPEFLAAGAVFWPDVVHSSSPHGHVGKRSLLWELLDMPFVPMFEQDDRQVLVNRDAAGVRTALRVLELFASQRPNLFAKLELVDRTKDYARLAWRKTRTSFHQVAVPPALGGTLLADGRFCGSYVVQHDPRGEPLFAHRQSVQPHEADVDASQPRSWFTHVQELEWRQAPQPLGTATTTTTTTTTTTATPLGDGDMMFHYDVRSFETSDPTSASATCLAHAGLAARVTTTAWTAVPTETLLPHRE